jgi:hypothetical protein
VQARAGGKVAAIETAQAASLGVEGPAGARDNKLVAEVGKRHLFRTIQWLRAVGEFGIVVGGTPTGPDKAGCPKATNQVFRLRAV